MIPARPKMSVNQSRMMSSYKRKSPRLLGGLWNSVPVFPGCHPHGIMKVSTNYYPREENVRYDYCDCYHCYRYNFRD